MQGSGHQPGLMALTYARIRLLLTGHLRGNKSKLDENIMNCGRVQRLFTSPAALLQALLFVCLLGKIASPREGLLPKAVSKAVVTAVGHKAGLCPGSAAVHDA